MTSGKKDEHNRENTLNQKTGVTSGQPYEESDVTIVKYGDDKGWGKRRECKDEGTEPHGRISHDGRASNTLWTHYDFDEADHVVAQRDGEHWEVGGQRKHGEELQEDSEGYNGEGLELVNVQRIEIAAKADRGKHAQQYVQRGNQDEVNAKDLVHLQFVLHGGHNARN